MRHAISILIALFGSVIGGSTAFAQHVLNPADVTLTAINSCANGTFVEQDFEVTNPGTVADVDLGLRAIHPWRGDIRARLVSPAGTIVELITPDTGATGNLDNYRITLDDEAPIVVNEGAHNANQPANGDRYEVSVRPDNPLSAFDGEPANGTWTLELCDAFPGADDGEVTDTTLFITPTQLPQPPVLSCSVGAPVDFDWALTGPNSWAAGSLVNGYTADTIPLSFAFSGDTNRLIARNGTPTPVTSAEFSPPGGNPSLSTNADFLNLSEFMTITVNLGTAGLGVEAAQFSLQDVDRNGWQDRISVTGSLDGSAVSATLTPNLANSVVNGELLGTDTVASGETAANAVVTFDQPIDQLVLTYGNGPGADANPPGQIMGLFADMQLCPRPLPALSAVKSVEAATVDALMTPGAEVTYRITVSHNPDSVGPATNVDIQDVLPPTLRFVSATTAGFTAGSFGNPALPASDTDCVSGACIVNFEDGTLPNTVTGEILITAQIK